MYSIITLLHVISFATVTQAGGFGTGLREPTPEEVKHQQKIRIKKVKPNLLGINRANEERKKNGLPELDPKDAADSNSEIISETAGVISTSTDTANGAAAYPAQVDNQALAAFPAIGNQSSEASCVAWATTYYSMSHETCLARGCDNKNLSQAVFSPRWTYNMINGGNNVGTYFYDANNVIQYHGAAKLAELPYTAGNYRFWDSVSSHWVNAINYRMNPVQTITSMNTLASQENVKQLLANGHVLVIGTYISSFVFSTVKADPATSSNPFTGQPAVVYLNGNAGAHAMTLAGYDDSIWIDINGNGIVDSGEKGAFKVVNSWGTGCGQKCGNGTGYVWLSYDSLHTNSQVTGGPSTGRVAAIMGGAAYFQSAKASYQPKLVGRFTLNSLSRNQMKAIVGTSSPTITSGASNNAETGMLKFQGGTYAFDGSLNPVPFTFALDLTDAMPAAGTTNLNYYVTVNDSAAGNPLNASNFDLYDPQRGVVAASSAAVTADGSTNRLLINYTWVDPNLPPVARISNNQSASPYGLMVNFDASGSYDQDGSVVSYNWNFGDGTTGSGAQVSHNYNKLANFTAVLTVTDNKGATSQSSVVIQNSTDTVAPTAANNVSGFLTRDTIGVFTRLNWGASIDNSGGTLTYLIYRNGVYLKSTTNLTVRDRTVPRGTSVYTIRTRDAAGNVSAQSNSVTIIR